VREKKWKNKDMAPIKYLDDLLLDISSYSATEEAPWVRL
jgi:hypothetical protein